MRLSFISVLAFSYGKKKRVGGTYDTSMVLLEEKK